MKLWLLDQLAYRSERIGEWLSTPFFRVSRWATQRWWVEERRTR